MYFLYYRFGFLHHTITFYGVFLDGMDAGSEKCSVLKRAGSVLSVFIVHVVWFIATVGTRTKYIGRNLCGSFKPTVPSFTILSLIIKSSNN